MVWIRTEREIGEPMAGTVAGGGISHRRCRFLDGVFGGKRLGLNSTLIKLWEIDWEVTNSARQLATAIDEQGELAASYGGGRATTMRCWPKQSEKVGDKGLYGFKNSMRSLGMLLP